MAEPGDPQSASAREPAPQRVYRAPCPGCGAPVDFRSAQSVYAVCSFCHSTVVRSGEVLSRIGKMAELFADYSPLQMMSAGRFDGAAFTVVGRQQFKSEAGVWSEWHVALQDGSSAFLSEDNGHYVFSKPMALLQPAPPALALRIGAVTAVGGVSYSVAFNGQVTLIAAEGELPRLSPPGTAFAMAELRSEQGAVLSLEYDSDPPGASLGRAVRLEDLALTGLRDGAAEKTEAARQFACPHCGAPVTVQREESKTVTCPSCRSIIALETGIGGEMASALQSEPVRPLIALGSSGKLQGVPWQVVGFQHRMGREPGDDERFGWSEYLLYHRTRGFSFLVDSSEGWSLVAPATGAPKLSRDENSASYLGTSYQLQSRYAAETVYVAGEFYWRVERGQTSDNSDYASGRNLLSRERTRSEVTWSIGSQLQSATVAAAFNMPDWKKDMAVRSDAKPLSFNGLGSSTVIVMAIVLVLLLLVLSRCSACDPTREYCGAPARTGGGSWGGYTSGGYHK
jgi:ribosomal protein L37AE/L43A